MFFCTPRQVAALALSLTVFANQAVVAEPLPQVAAPEETTASDATVNEPLDGRVTEQIAAAITAAVDENFPVKASYGSKGFRLETRDGNWQTNLKWRFQFRLTNPTTGAPRQVEDFEAKDKTTFEARRVRMKIGGHGYRPWLKYYFEVDLQPTRESSESSSKASARVIDWRVDVAKYKAFGLRVGQWKIDYSRERVDSSGRQQFVDRSIANRVFTVDRQVGVSFRGHLFEGTRADMKYSAGVFTGEGRGVSNDDTNMMYAGRLQWNFLGRDVPFRQSDVERTEHPAAALGFGAATQKGVCTRWSSSGCGNLDGFAKPGDDPDSAKVGQYRVVQAVQDLAFKWQGFSFQQEFHWKRVTDREEPSSSSLRDSDLFGGYAQAGYFFNEIFDFVPEELELAFRYAYVREPNEVNLRKNNKRREYTAGANWFFAGHNNKLTLDYSYLTLNDSSYLTLNDSVESRNVSDHRTRLQWDISF